jgi:hypothetical protein
MCDEGWKNTAQAALSGTGQHLIAPGRLTSPVFYLSGARVMLAFLMPRQFLCRQLPGARHGLLTSWRAASAELLPQETVLRSSSRLAVICSPDFSRSGESKSSPRAADPLHGTSISVSVTGTGSEQHTLHPVRADTIGVASDKGVARYRRYTSASRSHFVEASARSRGRLDAMEQSTRYGV